MKKTMDIIRWIGATIFVVMAISSLSTGAFLSSLLFLLGGTIIMPLEPIKKLRSKWKLNKALSIFLAVVLLFAGVLLTPSPAIETSTNNTNLTSPVTDGISNGETIIDSPSTNTNEGTSKDETTTTSSIGAGFANPVSLSSIPAYSGKAYVDINNNIPNFSASELKTTGYEKYSELDNLGRTGVALASVGKETMPKDGEERGDISSIKPTGWNQAKYDCVSGGWLYNRCHLIGWQLSAENANKKNLLTGTKYLNINGMLPFENMVADYIKETGNHVAYRITPIYDGDNLVCSGVQMEAYSIEDNGEGVEFNVYCYNVQPGIKINYADGSSSSTSNSNDSTSSSNPTISTPNNNTSNDSTSSTKYVLNTSSKKFHYPSCGSAKRIASKNYAESNESRGTLISRGYSPCGNCDP